MKLKEILIVVVINICINESFAAGTIRISKVGQKTPQSFFESLINNLKTSPEELQLIQKKTFMFNFCNAKICSRPLNLSFNIDF